jgi:DNA-binding NtrC family response regulator
MSISHAIILSQDLEIISLFQSLGNEMRIKVVSKPNLANFLLGLQENDYQIAIFDCIHMDSENLKWIKVVRKVRPKIPLIILSDEVDQKTGGKVYEEGIFYRCVRPVDKNMLRDILDAALTFYQSEINIKSGMNDVEGLN